MYFNQRAKPLLAAKREKPFFSKNQNNRHLFEGVCFVFNKTKKGQKKAICLNRASQKDRIKPQKWAKKDPK